ncbi:elongation of very long chain fatty acids protein AAEL008004-like [Macrosteles quadrilineatus]|uniref:elongation of very long chain fatty acids protein AAEL008004-like n=1 Tax=Macrosteles quadrilineatus TaxID=74068 RepID=UPI0023E133F2|nr:elongation of very long chain fatty acids protein AAEL008004-like [Macrosteles quadrilineatus]XP_054263723.1 elongation of very long chain fatty acids protein AAEL008004-like [Macrosteles quadrilineatus]
MTSYISDYYNYIVYEQMDQRVKAYYFMGSPVPILLLVTSYLVFVLRLGPWFMKNRPPYNVEKPMMLYNIVQMAINLYFVLVACLYVWLPGHYNWICQRPIYEPNPVEDIVVGKFYLFMCSRILDLLDTVFMVLKKNNHQISFLHLYHHTFVATACWICVKYMPGGQPAFFGTLNAFVHVVMYFYYFLTAIDASYKKSIWWKRHITELQLAQFFILLVQQLYAILSPTCDFSKYLLAFFLSQAILMIYLFSNFYYNAYIKKQPKKTKTS